MLRDFKEPDVKAPRNGATKLNLIDLTMHRNFKKKYPQHKNLPYTQFTKIIHNYGTTTWKNVIENRDGVELPQSLGYLIIATCRQAKVLDVNYALSKKHGKIIRNQDHESDGHLAKIFYTNYSNKYKFKNREVWSFTGIRQFKRGVAATYPTLWKQYVVVEPFMRISQIFKNHMKSAFIKKRDTDIDLTNYDEFNLD